MSARVDATFGGGGDERRFGRVAHHPPSVVIAGHDPGVVAQQADQQALVERGVPVEPGCGTGTADLAERRVTRPAHLVEAGDRVDGPTATSVGLHGGHGRRDTVAMRMPAHPVALRLLAAFGGGLAVPSANRFGCVSPTTAADVRADLGDEVELIIDGGPCEIGVESTIVELVGGRAGSQAMVTILRSGAIGPEALAGVLGHPVGTTARGPARAPGMLASHYAPRTPLELWPENTEDEAARRVADLVSSGARVGALCWGRIEAPGAAVAWDAGSGAAVFARSLYQWLRRADAEDLDILVVVMPPPEGISLAVRDRLRRAATR